MMTLADVQVRVDLIRDLADDCEAGHGAEDELHQDVLLAIAEGRAENPALMAALALTTLAFKHCRHYA